MQADPIQVEYVVDGSAFWATSEQENTFDCIVKFSHLDEEVAFTCHKDDELPHNLEVYNIVINGEAGEISPYIEPEDFEGDEEVI